MLTLNTILDELKEELLNEVVEEIMINIPTGNEIDDDKKQILAFATTERRGKKTTN